MGRNFPWTTKPASKPQSDVSRLRAGIGGRTYPNDDQHPYLGNPGAIAPLVPTAWSKSDARSGDCSLPASGHSVPTKGLKNDLYDQTSQRMRPTWKRWPRNRHQQQSSLSTGSITIFRPWIGIVTTQALYLSTEGPRESTVVEPLGKNEGCPRHQTNGQVLQSHLICWWEQVRCRVGGAGSWTWVGGVRSSASVRGSLD